MLHFQYGVIPAKAGIQYLIVAGCSPAAGHFSCVAKKSNPKKATPVCRAFGVPSIVANKRGCATRTIRSRPRAQTVLA